MEGVKLGEKESRSIYYLEMEMQLEQLQLKMIWLNKKIILFKKIFVIVSIVMLLLRIF